MKRTTFTLGTLAFVTLVGCRPQLAPVDLKGLQAQQLYTCCNIYYEHGDLVDANYRVGAQLPLGTPVQVLGAVRGGVTFSVDGKKFNLHQSYGTEQESLRSYLAKVLVTEDPKPRFAELPEEVQHVIRDGRVERGMTRQEVLLSLGYPPTHRTASTDLGEWTYWYNRFRTYRVQFDSQGHVSQIIGRAPTRNQPVR